MRVKTPASELSFSCLGNCARGVDSVITRLMAEKLARPEMLSLAAGFTDNRLLPDELVGEAVSLLAETENKAHLQYGMNRGRLGLRGSVIDLLRSYPGEENLRLTEENILITNGSQQALYIIVQMLCDPGDIVLVESPSYFVFLELLIGLGVKAVSIPMDAEGRTDAAALETLFEKLTSEGSMDRIKLVYLMGAFANPSTRCIDEAEKNELARVLLGLDRPIPVVEDMAYRELFFHEPYPARSLLSLEQWENYPVIYAGTFTKPFATGMKVGFIATRDRDCLDTVATIKGHQDFGTAHFNQAILEHVMRTGKYATHLASIRKEYVKKRDMLEDSLVEYGLREAGWSWNQPTGGLLLWALGPDGTDTRMGSVFHRICIEKEILYVPGNLCFAVGAPHTYVRLSFGALESELIPEAARRFCEAALEARRL